MSAGEALSGVQFRYNGAGGAHRFTAHDGDTEVGHLRLHPGGEVDMVRTDPNYRRRGVASALWTVANEMHRKAPDHFPQPLHSNERSDEGDQWARKVGGRVPRRTARL